MKPEMRARLDKAIEDGMCHAAELRLMRDWADRAPGEIAKAVVAWLEAEGIEVRPALEVTEETGVPEGAVLELAGARVVDRRARGS